MVKVSAFKGITYNNEKIKDLDLVMSPPYDIISPKHQDQLYENSPYNFVRLILGKQYSDDTDKINRYTRAKKDFEQWQKDHILIPTDHEAIYPYKITYTLDDEQKTMNGFFILLHLDKDYKKVKAHERTLSKPKADRLNLMRACYANLEPIQLLYIDEQDEINHAIKQKISGDPLINVTGYDGFDHAIWKLTDEHIINKIKSFLDDDILFIADGHHRYQTAINYANEMEEKTGNRDSDAPFQYRMVIVANMFDEGLSILPTHRLLHLPKQITKDKLITNLKEYFNVNIIPREETDTPSILADHIKKQIETKSQHKFAFLFKDNYIVITLKDESVMENIAKDRSEIWRKLDVSILHKIVIEKIMGITQDTLEDYVKYTRDDEEAITVIDDGEYDCSILMNATKIQELKAIADAGEHMPQKSTYFLPKMLSGLVMYDMNKKE
ncbi:MAG: DUF1015 domain-containing protein [Candidatus Thermoplasmatota archaeon]|nr:DUF1015 domain-containing protein [Candidatus Thermoplasmatota archaeon]